MAAPVTKSKNMTTPSPPKAAVLPSGVSVSVELKMELLRSGRLSRLDRRYDAH